MVDKRIADMVLMNGVIYTADAEDSLQQAVAIQGEYILFVGSDDEVHEYIGGETRIIDLNGKMVMPGMIDTHIHPPGLSLSEQYEVRLAGIKSLAECLEAVEKFIAIHPEMNVVYGRGWSWGILEGDELNKGPRKEYLDAVNSEIPIVLRADDGHTLWVNSKAFEVNGVTRDTIPPKGGTIEKDPISGELWGTLKEWAMRLIALPDYSLAQYIEAMVDFQHRMHQLGITGVLCLGSQTLPTIFQACSELQKRGELQLRIRGAMTIHAREDLQEQLAKIRELQSQYQTFNLKITSAKFFADGVIEGGTGFLLEPYSLEAGKGKGHYGDFLWDLQQLKQAFCEVNQAGLQIHVHSTGDGSTQNVLNALEDAKSRIPAGDYRNIITHLQLVDEMDISRFKTLDVIASVQPYWHYKTPNWWHSVDYRLLGKRAEKEYPLQSFFNIGSTVVSSSDYPITMIPNPFIAIETGVTRNMAQGGMHEIEDITDGNDGRFLLNAEERATVQEMIRSFTINGAYCMFMEKEIGSIEPGKLADFIVLDRDILKINPLDIDKAKVVMTFFNGRMVYEQTLAQDKDMEPMLE